MHLKYWLPFKTSRGFLTSCEFLTGRVPDLSHARTWGCKAWVLEPRNAHRKDFHAQSIVGWFADTSDASNGWDIWCPELNGIVTSVNVTFDENIPEPDKAYHEELRQGLLVTAPNPEDVGELREKYVGKTFTEEDDGHLYEVMKIRKNRDGYIVAEVKKMGAKKITRAPLHVAEMIRMMKDSNDPGGTCAVDGRESVSFLSHLEDAVDIHRVHEAESASYRDCCSALLEGYPHEEWDKHMGDPSDGPIGSDCDGSTEKSVEAGSVHPVSDSTKSSVAGIPPVAAGNTVAGDAKPVANMMKAHPQAWGMDANIWEKNPEFTRIDSDEQHGMVDLAALLSEICVDEKLRDYVMHTEAGDDIPQSRAEMLKLPTKEREAFIAAELRELDRIAELEVIEGEVPIPPGIRPINSRFVYDYKDPVSQEGAHQFGQGEMPERLAKCRLTMKDMKNVPNYLSGMLREVFAPTGQGITFRILMVLMLVLGLDCTHIDVSTAFLYAMLQIPIFMNPPVGYPCAEGHCLKVVRSLYGCRSAPRDWYKLLRGFILSLGFTESVLDACLFMRGTGTGIFLIFIYVDDILLFCADKVQTTDVYGQFCKRFKCKNLGEVKRFLGVWVEISIDRSSVFLHQGQYCKKIVEKFRPFWDIFKKTQTLPLPVDIQKELAEEEVPLQEGDDNYDWWNMFPYFEMIGSALYLAIQTRPNVTFAVNLLARYSRTKPFCACVALAHLFSFMYGTTDEGILYSLPKITSSLFDDWLDMYGMSDSDWAGCLRTRRSTAGFLLSLLGGAVAWGSKVMATIATSSMEAEYMAAYYLGQTICFVRNLLGEIGLSLSKPTPFFMDAMAAIQAIKNGELSARTKHFDVKVRWMGQLARRAIVECIHLRGTDMTADLLTKAITTMTWWNTLNPHLSGKERRTAKQLVQAQKREKDTPFPTGVEGK